MTAKHFVFFSATIAAFLSAILPLSSVFHGSLRDDPYSHIPLIPLISAYLLYRRKNVVFHCSVYEPKWGIPIATVGLFFFGFAMWSPWLSSDIALFLMVLSLLLSLFGLFVSIYGRRSFTRAFFPLFFLFLMLPIPAGFLRPIGFALQVGSTEVVEFVFKIANIPYLRERFVFHLPGLSIEVAQQCGGIRSSLALLIISILAGHFYLQAYWQKIVLIISLLPIVLIKNGVRISVLTFLGMYVDQRILTEGFLHRSGGILFFLPALGLVWVILCLLRTTSSVACHPKNSASANVTTATHPLDSITR